MSVVGNVKTRIKSNLDALVSSSNLGQVIISDFNKKSIWEYDIATYPAAIISTPGIPESVGKTNGQNLRTYEFEIIVVEKGENIDDTSQIEDLMEVIANKFDNDPTLGGVACGAVDPVVTPAMALSNEDKTFVVFSVIIRAKVMIDLTF